MRPDLKAIRERAKTSPDSKDLLTLLSYIETLEDSIEAYEEESYMDIGYRSVVLD